MEKRNDYRLVKENYYALKRLKKKVLKAAIMVDLGIGVASAITVFCFNIKAPVDKNANVVYFNEEVHYLDMEDEANQKLVMEIQDYYHNQYNNDLISVNQETLTMEQQTIMRFCAIYQVDYHVVYSKLAELTNNFTSEDYLKGTILGLTFKGEDLNFGNKEVLLAMAVRCCAQRPDLVNLDETIKVDVPFESNMDIFQQVTVYANLFGLDRREVYSIIRAENNFGSNLTDETNNFGSLKIDGSFSSYDNVSQGILETCAEIYKFRNKYGITATGEEFLRQVQPYYAPTEDVLDYEAELNANWLNNAVNSYREATSLDVFHDGTLTMNYELDKQAYYDYATMDRSVCVAQMN